MQERFNTLKSSHLRNLVRIVISALFIVNLYTLVDNVVCQDSLANDNQIELLLIQNQYECDSVDFDQLNQSFSLYETVSFYKKNQNLDYQINSQNSLEQLRFNTQKHTSLNFKSTLLQIVCNEILIQTSHCI